MTAGQGNKAGWTAAFLAALRDSGNVTQAARSAGVDRSAAYQEQKIDEAFAARWQDAMAASPRTARARKKKTGPAPDWQNSFLAALAETSNVSAACARARMPKQAIYALRREDPRFSAAWSAALLEGYQHLELELLGYLRDPAPRHKMDTGAALRLLAVHRESVGREQARRARTSEQDVLAELKQRFERLRDTETRAKRLLIEDGTIMPDSDAGR